MPRALQRSFWPFVLAVVSICVLARAWPPGVVEQTIADGWNAPVGLCFAEDGRMFVWEKGGRVWNVENDVKAPQPLIDLHEEVGNWRDHGLLGFALDEEFLENGFVYLLYVVDYHHLAHFGTPQYDPQADEYFHDTIARVVRFTCTAASDFRDVDYGSRTVLIGESIDSGIPICHQSHGAGSLVIGEDHTLLVSCGDGASYSTVDVGGAVSGSSNTALADGILRAKEDVGAFRAQLVDCLNGKVLRIDAATGDGVPSNPFFDAGAPRAPRSRVWALGLRNPFRMTLLPGSGAHDPALGDPGTLLIGDVGWNEWEELDVCDGPAQNFGWPIYEGLESQASYAGASVANRDAPNPLFGGACANEFFGFEQLIVQDTLEAPSWPNPCDAGVQIPATLARFEHVRPVLDWHHGAGPSRTKVYSGNHAAVIDVGAPNSPVAGPQFGGSSALACTWFPSASLGAAFQDTLVFGDFVASTLHALALDAFAAPLEVRLLAESGDASSVVDAAYDAVSDALYVLEYDELGVANVKRIVATGDQPPVVVANATPQFGPAPLAVQFNASGSSDPEGLPLVFAWDFGDGTQSNEADPLHVYEALDSSPARRDVALSVTDSNPNTVAREFVVSLNNTPPLVQITSPVDGALYPLGENTLVVLDATVSDAEHSAAELTCVWQTSLHHDEHSHPEPPVAQCSTTALISPVGCDGHTYFYEFTLTVSDGAGLVTTQSVFMYPDCCGVAPTTYCTAKTNSLGCVPTIASSGSPSVSQTSGLVISASEVLNHKLGLAIYSLNGRSQLPAWGGVLCISPQLRRTRYVDAGGTPSPANDCSGVFSIDFSAFSHGLLGGTPHPELLVAGTPVNLQWWGRDPGFATPNNITLSAGLEFVTCP